MSFAYAIERLTQLVCRPAHHLYGQFTARPTPITLIDRPTEQTTSTTDAILAFLAGGFALALIRQRQRAPWKITLWTTAFGTLCLASVLGTVVHGFTLSEQTITAIWQPLNLSLAITIALFVTGVLYDRYGQRVAQRILPLMLLVAAGFFTYTLLRPGSFLPFIVYQSIGMLFALFSYGWLALHQHAPGAAWMSAGILTSIIAAAIQASRRVHVTLIWPFDHNGTFHLIQMPALSMLYIGLRKSLPAT